MLDPITEQEIKEYEEYCKQQDAEFEAGLMTQQEYEEYLAREDAKEWAELADNADYYNDYECFGM